MSAPDLSSEALAALEELARAATPGPWEKLGRRYVCGPEHVIDEHDQELVAEAVINAQRNAAYIAATSPDVILALVEAARERDALALRVRNLRHALSFIGDHDSGYGTGVDRQQVAIDALTEDDAALAQPDEAEGA